MNFPGKKDDRMCTHYNAGGHTKDTCFKLHGYSNWFIELKQKKKQEKASAVTVSQQDETPLDIEKLHNNGEWSNMIQQKY